MVIPGGNSGSHITIISQPDASKYDSLCHSGTRNNSSFTYNLYILLLIRSNILGFNLYTSTVLSYFLTTISRTASITS